MLGGVRPVAAGQAPAQLQGTRLSYLQWVNFVPAHDAALKKQIAEFEKQTGAKVTFETINMNDIQARTTVAIESKSGPDIIQLAHNWPHLYEPGLEPVDDLAEELGRKGEGYYDLPKSHSFVNGRWRAVPHSIVSPAPTYRTDWFKEVGYEKFPDSWEGYREAGKKLKAKGHPIGQSLGHSLGDPPIFCYAMLWAFGAKEVEADGKTVALDSKETLEAVEFGVGFWKDACDEGGLAWDDASNNRAYPGRADLVDLQWRQHLGRGQAEFPTPGATHEPRLFPGRTPWPLPSPCDLGERHHGLLEEQRGGQGIHQVSDGL